jgi:hypothetical protein
MLADINNKNLCSRNLRSIAKFYRDFSNWNALRSELFKTTVYLSTTNQLEQEIQRERDQIEQEKKLSG